MNLATSMQDVYNQHFNRGPVLNDPPPPPPAAVPIIDLADPEIAKMIVAARGGQSDQTGPASANETTVQLPLSGQCGFAGCSQTTLVAFTFRSSGANTSTNATFRFSATAFTVVSGASSAWSSGRLVRKRSEKISCPRRSRSSSPAASASSVQSRS